MGRTELGRLVQLVGVLMLGGGIVLEVVMGADVWYVLITVGSAVFAVGCKLRKG